MTPDLTPITLLAQAAAADAARDIAYLLAAFCFIFGIKRLRSPKTARAGNALASVGMALAILATLLHADPGALPLALGAVVLGSGIGAVLALRVQMTQMPQMVALFNGFGGLASVLVVTGEWAQARTAGETLAGAVLLMVGLSALIGCVTFSGSIVAAGKLHGAISGAPVRLPAQIALNIAGVVVALALVVVLAGWAGPGWALALLVPIALALGVALTVPIGGADMPVMVSLLNSYSGLAAAATGFVVDYNLALIVSGALVGASGLILTAIMCKAMNRSLANVLFAGVGTADSTGAAGTTAEGRAVKSADPEDLAIMLDAARRVMIVPGYGMAVAQAQHAVRELADVLTARGVTVMYGVHPVAGRMPGHMNVLLAEADVPYEQLLDLEQANAEIETCDVALVIGANDVVNPAARHDATSPIFGMPIIDVDKAGACFVLKRSLGAGYAGVQNELFFADRTLMVFGDAKQTLQKTLAALKEL
ncbi:MAG: NAD(P)(+) transhydrogenase (Re/Si-specific) subunit beta [Planctomycetota bacterium]|nr:MAG: NAD(P)(+) transhydrogenase (Re/Si-specific) subunit beta [Planctomycetota bacterium]